MLGMFSTHKFTLRNDSSPDEDTRNDLAQNKYKLIQPIAMITLVRYGFFIFNAMSPRHGSSIKQLDDVA